MTTVTLELPDDLAQRLQQLDGETLIKLLQSMLPPPQILGELPSAPTDYDELKVTDDTSNEPQFVILPPLIPEGDFALVPPKRLPKRKPRTLSKEEWRKKLLAMPPLDEETIRGPYLQIVTLPR